VQFNDIRQKVTKFSHTTYKVGQNSESVP